MGKETARSEPVVSYYCTKYAVEKGMELMKVLAEPERGLCQQQVMSMMTDLEQKGQAMTLTDVEGRAYCEEFAIRLFGRLDGREKEGGADKKMAQHFLVASTFFEILRQSDNGDLEDKLQEMQMYAAWKAGQIVKALKRGDTPAPGPPGWVPPAAAPESGDFQEISLSPAPVHVGQSEPGPPSKQNPFPHVPINEPTINPFPQPPVGMQPPPALDDFGLPQPPVGIPGVPQPAVADGLQNAYIKPQAPFAQMVAPAPEPPPAYNHQQAGPPAPPAIQPTANQLQQSAAGLGVPKSFARNGSSTTSLGYTWDQLCGIVEAEKDARAALRLLGAGHEDIPAALETLKALLPKIEEYARVQAGHSSNNAA